MSKEKAVDFLNKYELKQKTQKPDIQDGIVPLKLFQQICKIYKVKQGPITDIVNVKGEDYIDYKNCLQGGIDEPPLSEVGTKLSTTSSILDKFIQRNDLTFVNQFKTKHGADEARQKMLQREYITSYEDPQISKRSQTIDQTSQRGAINKSLINPKLMKITSVNRFQKDKRHHEDYPDRMKQLSKGRFTKINQTFEQLIDQQINQCKEERPTVLRSNVVDKYIIDILAFDKNPKEYKEKMEVVKKMLYLRMDNRILNNMRQAMNDMIKDEQGLMSIDEFKSMFYTSFRQSSEESKDIIFNMLLPLIQKEKNFVSISNLSKFIDFYNFAPIIISKIRHKNETSSELYLKASRPMSPNEGMDKALNMPEFQKLNEIPEDKKNLIKLEGLKMRKLLSLISCKIQERFQTLLAAFRFFDNDHMLSLTLNEFAQGIEHLRIKISFSHIRDIFNYLDQDKKEELTFKEFRLLDEENLTLNKFNIHYLHYQLNKIKEKQSKSTASKPRDLDTLEKLSKLKFMKGSVRNGLDPNIISYNSYVSESPYKDSDLSSRLSQSALASSNKHQGFFNSRKSKKNLISMVHGKSTESQKQIISNKLTQQPQGPIQDLVSFSYLRDSLENRVKKNEELQQRNISHNSSSHLQKNIRNIVKLQANSQSVLKPVYKNQYQAPYGSMFAGKQVPRHNSNTIIRNFSRQDFENHKTSNQIYKFQTPSNNVLSLNLDSDVKMPKILDKTNNPLKIYSSMAFD